MATNFEIERIIRDAGEGAIERIVSDLADIAVVVGSDGIVVDVPHARAPAERLRPEAWRGLPFSETMTAASRPVAGDLLARVMGGRSEPGREILHLGPGDDRLAIRYGGTALAGGDAILLLGQAAATRATGSAVDFGAVFSAGATGLRDDLGDILRHGADLVVLIDERGRLLWANDAFLDAAEVSRVTGVEGRFLEDLLAWRGAGDVETLVEQAGAAGFSGPAAAVLRRDAGGDLPVTIGVTRLPRSAPPVFGAVIRAVDDAHALANTRQGVEAVTDMLDSAGHVPLKGLVRETADMVERHCLQAALRLTGNNRSAAARALGISRQALYQKLERFGLMED